MEPRRIARTAESGAIAKAAPLTLILALMTATTAITASAALAATNHRQGAQTAVPSARQKIIQLEHRWLANEYNPALLKAILAPDFVHVLPQGFISKQEQIAFVRAHAQPRYSVHKFAMLRVRVYGRVAIANGIVEVLPARRKTVQKIFFTDVFALRNGRWRAVNAQETNAAANSKQP